MAIRTGSMLHFGNDDFLIQRLAEGGAQEPNLSRERLFELGNWNSIGTRKGIPQVTYNLNSFDVSTDIEALLTRLTPSAIIDGQIIDLADAKPFDIVSPWKDPLNDEDANAGVVVPYQLLTSASYRFGVRQTAQQQFQLVGDAIYFVTEGVPRQDTYAAAGTGPYAFSFTPAIRTVEKGDDVYAYSVCIIESDGSFSRLFIGEDFTNDANGFTLTATPPVGSTIHVTYASDDGPEQYPNTIHASSTVKPVDIQASDIKHYISDGAATPTLLLIRGLQSVEWNWRVNREPDEELGNAHYVAYDFDTPDLSGNFTMRALDVEYLMRRIAQFLGTTYGETANVLADTPLEMVSVISHPDTGVPIKSLRTPDAIINPPGTAATANTKYEQQFSWQSETGDFEVVKGSAL